MLLFQRVVALAVKEDELNEALVDLESNVVEGANRVELRVKPIALPNPAIPNNLGTDLSFTY